MAVIETSIVQVPLHKWFGCNPPGFFSLHHYFFSLFCTPLRIPIFISPITAWGPPRDLFLHLLHYVSDARISGAEHANDHQHSYVQARRSPPLINIPVPVVTLLIHAFIRALSVLFAATHVAVPLRGFVRFHDDGLRAAFVVADESDVRPDEGAFEFRFEVVGKVGDEVGGHGCCVGAGPMG